MDYGNGMTEQKRGIRHGDRLLRLLLEIAENPNLETSDRLEASNQALVVLGRRQPFKRDPKKKAIEKMLGKRTKEQ